MTHLELEVLVHLMVVAVAEIILCITTLVVYSTWKEAHIMQLKELTYSSSAEGVWINEQRVKQELAAHGFTSPEDFDMCIDYVKHEGDYRTTVAGERLYNAGDVLRYLGY